jgi:NTP pyrophosphatase (non-canonical NTP hydrolase)
MPHGDDTNGQKNGKDGEETPASAAHYIAALAGELAEIAKRNGLDTLSAILEMARLEADHAAKH